MEKFNGSNFELSNLKMEGMPIDRDMWTTIFGTNLKL